MMNKHLVLYTLLSIAAVRVRADVILYDNTATDTGYTDGFVANELVEAGDEITLASSALANSAMIGLYNSSSSGGSADVTLRLYDVNGSTLGSLLYTGTASGLSFSPSTNTYYTFNSINTMVPQTLVWTLSYTTVDSIAPELLDFDPPVTGTSDNTTVWWDQGSGLALTTPGYSTENYYFSLSGTPVPEPDSWGLLGIGLAVMFWRHRLAVKPRVASGK